MAAGVTKNGAGVSVTGGVGLDDVSPDGTWSLQWDGQTVDFNRDAFAKLIADKGYDVLWEKAVLCPNIPDGGLSPRDHDIDCQICGGFEFIYVDPTNTTMLMQGIRLDQSYYAYGRWDFGQMMVTSMPGSALNYFDRLTLCSGTSRFTERIVRQPSTQLDLLKYLAVGIDYVAWVNRSKQLVKFSQDDYALSSDGASIQWLTSTPPDDRTHYSIAYRYHPRYVVLNLTHHHRVSTVQGKHYAFPTQGVAKLDFLVRDQSRDAPETVDTNPFPR